MDVEKAKMMSLDMTQENVKKIQALFPNAVTEVIGEDGKVKLAVDFDVLKQELSDSLIDDAEVFEQINNKIDYFLFFYNLMNINKYFIKL